MTKKFNIHDWQAKQRQQLLTEEDEWQKRQDAQTPGKNPEYFYDKDSIIGKLKKDPDYIKKLNAKNTKKEHHNDEDFPGKDLSSWDLLDKIKAGDKDLYNKVEDFMKSMDSEPSESNDSMWTSTSTADIPSDEEEKASKAKPNWRDYRENTTGTGASVGAGAGEAFASPNAFKKKRK